MFRWPMLVLLLSATPALAAKPVGGRWITNDGKAVVEIGRCGASVCGRIARLLKKVSDGPATDVHNPDPKLRARPIEGLPILFGFTDSGADWRGKIYSPEEGKTYKSILALNPDGSLKVKGCIAFFCRTLTWKKAG